MTYPLLKLIPVKLTCRKCGGTIDRKVPEGSKKTTGVCFNCKKLRMAETYRKRKERGRM